MDMGCCYSEFHASDDRITRETLSNNNPCPSSPSSTIYIYIYIYIKDMKESFIYYMHHPTDRIAHVTTFLSKAGWNESTKWNRSNNPLHCKQMLPPTHMSSNAEYKHKCTFNISILSHL